MNRHARRLLAATVATGLLAGGTPAVSQADAAPLKAKATHAEKKVKIRAYARKL
jgi:hypothetical protein